MHLFIRVALIISPILILSEANAAKPEDRYIATRNAAIAKFAKQTKDGKIDDSVDKAEAAARDDLKAQLVAILAEPAHPGFGPPQLNLDTLYQGDEGFGMLDGLRFDADTGKGGAKVGQATDGSYVEPKAHIVVTTESLFARWLREHKDWWDKGAKNVPQQIDAALKFEGLYTQAISTDAAVIRFNDLAVVKPAAATSADAFLAARSQDEAPDSADEVFAAARANGKVYIVYGGITPVVQVPACSAIRADTNKKAEQAEEKFRRKQIDKKAYDKLGNLRQRSEDDFKRCFIQHAPEQPAFADATRQARALLETALGK